MTAQRERGCTCPLVDGEYITADYCSVHSRALAATTIVEFADPVVDHPAHYATGWSNGAEVIDIVENLNFNRGNAVKYLARAGRKDPATEIQDLMKARWYLNREIDRLTNDTKQEKNHA